MSKLNPVPLCVLAGLSLGLSACGGNKDATSNTASADATATAPSAAATPATAAKVAAANLSEGPDVCFRAIAKHLGADAKVSDITSFFSSGSEIDSNDSEPK